ncbi:Rrf2 family transcriptional regulator [Rhizobium ruizarguesonis]
MRSDSRLSRMLHVLIHMDKHQHSATSGMIAKMLNTNPVVVRRTMAGLREQGYVRSEKGHGGGWTLVRPLSDITLLDVYRAIGEPHLFAIGPADDQPQCIVEQAVNVALGDAMKEAQALLLRRLDSVTLDKIAADFEAKLTARPATSYSCAS